MIRFIVVCILLIHGLIHLLGCVKEFRLARVEQLSGKTTIPLSADAARVVGVLWLFTCLLFITTTVGFLLRKDWWWMMAIVAVLLSQGLIMVYWSDAKFGTIANLIVLVAIIFAYANWRFQAMVRHERQAFLPQTQQEKKVVTEAMLADLPAAVQKWLKRSKIVGKEFVRTVYLKQKGEMRTTPDGKWMPVQAEQYFTVENPGFLWIADVRAAPFVHLIGRDKYEDGRGHMLIKLLSLFPVADAKGKETDQGTLLRYLAEIVWFPSAALSPYITWEGIDTATARATISSGGVTASGIFKFDPEGEVNSFEARRYYDRKEGATLENWFIAIDANSYRDFEGVRIPAKSTVTWKLETGDFTWYRLEIADVAYNQTGRGS